MVLKKAFISFDYDHDQGVKHLLVGQARNPDTPFSLADWSIKEAISEDWKKKARARIKACDVVIVLCGEHTGSAVGVSAEVKIAQEEAVPYFLLWAYPDKACIKPKVALSTDKIYKWSWDNMTLLIRGYR
jgi:hypothetical protein